MFVFVPLHNSSTCLNDKVRVKCGRVGGTHVSVSQFTRGKDLNNKRITKRLRKVVLPDPGCARNVTAATFSEQPRGFFCLPAKLRISAERILISEKVLLHQKVVEWLDIRKSVETVREHPLMTSTKFADFWTPSPLSACGTD